VLRHVRPNPTSIPYSFINTVPVGSTFKTKPLTLSELSELLQGYIDSGEVNGALSAQLSNSLAQAQHQYDKSSPAKAAKHLEDFLKHLNNPPMQEHISADAKSVLNQRVTDLLESWQIGD
jgi:hypothetical protein